MLERLANKYYQKYAAIVFCALWAAILIGSTRHNFPDHISDNNPNPFGQLIPVYNSPIYDSGTSILSISVFDTVKAQG